MKILILLVGLAAPANPPTLEDLVDDQIWRIEASGTLKRLLNEIEFESDLSYLSDNAMEATLNE